MSERNGTINTPAGNRIAIKVDIESAPRLLIDIVKFTDSSEGGDEDDLAYLPQLARGVRPP